MTPNIYNFDLWKTSGHADHYRENMFGFSVEKADYGLKPMNCPGGCAGGGLGWAGSGAGSGRFF